ncbi:Guanosine nucleotide diphosphate dissociation inhibitor 2, partial [Zea mays]
MKVSYDL